MHALLRGILLGCVGGAMAASVQPACAADPPARPEIRLLVRGDDIGSSHAANVACIRTCREGIVRSLEVMVPCAWFDEAARMLNENPGIDVGVHLTLTSEWEGCKWRPLTDAPSLVDEDGYFHPQTRLFLVGAPKSEEVERELRAQIELARKKIKNVTHLTSHMGTPTSRPDLAELVDSLAEEYGLAVDTSALQPFRGMGSSSDAFEDRLAGFLKALETLGPGTHLLVEHPGLDVPEMQALGHPGYSNVAAHRDGVTRLFTSEEVKELIARRRIRLIDYSQITQKR